MNNHAEAAVAFHRISRDLGNLTAFFEWAYTHKTIDFLTGTYDSIEKSHAQAMLGLDDSSLQGLVDAHDRISMS